MFGLNQLFAAVKRLAASINRSADLFDEANAQLEQRLRIEDEPAIVADDEARTSNRKAKLARA